MTDTWWMETVSKRELNQNTASVLARVREHGPVVVTERGRAQWRITASGAHESMLSSWEAQGRYVRPSHDPSPWPITVGGPAYSNEDVEALLNEMRGER